ncbi:STAS domain-containing protein [Planosporangium thailandense]|uniref:Anti-sigma factor antagonist n=1 Tax=Planosporangium thailandense TaxID=765197 RepID=A0ABX0Y1X1_9ACTN|nr:STAS domain-containing protein [Planosporangium thailandense]NJC72086.1 STAS domain-containing protein [Planosporangium thailandense]
MGWRLALTFTQRVRADGAGLVVSLHGEMDADGSDSFERATQRLIAQRRPRLLHIDLADLRFLDSAGVSAIVRLWRLARRERCSLRVVNPTGAVRRALEMTGALAIVGGGSASAPPPGPTL